LIEVAKKDYQSVGAQLALGDTAEQVRAGAKVTHRIVDGSETKTIEEWERDIRILFVDAAVMIRALNDAWREILTIARTKSGFTKAHFEVWQVSTAKYMAAVMKSPSGVRAEAIDDSTELMVVGPRVAWTRKYRYLFGVGEATRFRKSYDRKRKQKKLVPVSIHQAVVRMMKLRYRFLRIDDSWVDVANVNPGGHVPVVRLPTVTIRGPSRRGAVLH